MTCTVEFNDSISVSLFCPYLSDSGFFLQISLKEIEILYLLV